ncbi:Fip1 domain-containing protein [Xylariales sp. AK1849]|nr:Fip1 domain-containing protein [Xylariales sp. AK1849]
MDIDDEDDFYAPDEPETTQAAVPAAKSNAPVEQQNDEDLEEGEEEDEGAEMDEDDSDVDIITERKDGTKAPPPVQSRYSDIRNIPQRTTSSDAITKPAIKQEDSKSVSRTDLPAVATSKIDVNAIPIHKGTGKPITQVNIDQDLPENDKPWRNPGTDLSDYFNYGFDEFTWALYAAKQDNVRGEYSQDAIAQNNKKMMEDMQMMMMGGMPAGGGNGGGGMPGMPGMDGMPPEMQQMMQQMMSSGMDPSQMDPSAMSAMFSGMQNSSGNAAGGQGGQNQNFGGSGQAFGNNQAQGYGYDQGMGRGGGGGGFGRGRGGRRNW